MSYNILIFILLLIKIITNGNITDILVLKFKTYYPLTTNMLQNDTEYNSKDFINSFLFSQLYLEFETGNETDIKKGTNQTMKTIISSKTDSFILKNFNKNNITFCDYNASISSTFKLNMLNPSFCQSEEIFKLYTDISFENYKYANFSLDNYFCLNDSICGNVGTDIIIYKNIKEKDFITKMTKYLNGEEQNYGFYYTSEIKDEGIFFFGSMPHSFLKNKYNENDIVSFFSKTINYEFAMDSITFNGKEYPKDKDDNNDYYDFINIAISPDTEGIEFDKYYFDLLLLIFFDEYIEKKICIIEKDDLITTVIYCHGDKFGKDDINKFPKITFSKYKYNFNISFESEELFYYKDNKYFCKIYSKIGQSKRFVLGRMFLKKYLTIFNADKKQIYFYNNITGDNAQDKDTNFYEKYGKIIIILLTIGLLIFLIIGILIGKYVFKERKKFANELDDNYEYQPNKKKVSEPLYNSKDEE